MVKRRSQAGISKARLSPFWTIRAELRKQGFDLIPFQGNHYRFDRRVSLDEFLQIIRTEILPDDAVKFEVE